jgi:hypothetical protein
MRLYRTLTCGSQATQRALVRITHSAAARMSDFEFESRQSVLSFIDHHVGPQCFWWVVNGASLASLIFLSSAVRNRNTQLRKDKFEFLGTFQQRGRDEMGLINTFDIRVASFQISHRCTRNPGPDCRIALESSGKPAFEPYHNAWSATDYLYGLNAPGPPSPPSEVYDPNPDWRTRFQFVYFGKAHFGFTLGTECL